MIDVNAPVRADIILRALSKRHTRDIWLTEVKTGPTLVEKGRLHRIDALVIKPSWAHPSFTAYEVKVTRADFVGDDKWPVYLNYCHRFYFACPHGLIQRDEVPDPAGLVWVDPETLEVSVRKAARFRPIEIPWELLYYIVISKLESDRHPFFSSRREYLEAWVQDKKERRKLGSLVRSRMAQIVDEAQEKLARAEATEREVHGLRKAIDQIGKLLEAHGYSSWIQVDDDGLPWYVLDRLRNAFSADASPRLAQLIREARLNLELAERLMAGEGETKTA